MKMRKGFTLVELLIVIVIIGILAAAMLLSSGSATATATASTIISDLASLKSACMLYYADKADASDFDPTKLTITDLHAYMDNPKKFPSDGPAELSASAGGWFVGVKVPADALVKAKLKDKAATVGILAASTATASNYSDGSVAWMRAR